MYLVHLDMPKGKMPEADRLAIHIYSEKTAIGSWFSLNQLRDSNLVEEMMSDLSNVLTKVQLEKLNQYSSVNVEDLSDLKGYVEVVYGASNK